MNEPAIVTEHGPLVKNQPVQLYNVMNSGKVDTNNNEFDCGKEKNVIFIEFTNEGTGSVNIIFGGCVRAIPVGSSIRFEQRYPYCDKTLYRYEFGNAGGVMNPVNRLVITFIKAI